MKTKLTVAIGVIVVAGWMLGPGGIGARVGHRETAVRARPAAETPAAPPPPTKAAAESSRPRAARPAARGPAVAMPDDVRRVLPRLAALPADWRTFAPAAITIAPRADVEATFAVMRVKRDAGHTTWVGRGDVDGATMVAVASAGSWNAVISFPHGDQFTIAVAGGHVSVVETNPDLEICGEGLLGRVALREAKTPAVAAAPAAALPPASSDPSNPDATFTSDVTFFYDDSTEAAAQQTIDLAGLDSTPAEQIENQIRGYVEQANEDLTQSEAGTLQWRFAGLAKLPAYDDHGDTSMQTDLETISNTSTAAGRFAQQQAEADGADQLVLYIAKNRDYAGLAWTPGHEAVCAWGTSHLVLAHELAHNLGCDHDRETAGAADNDGRYNYGYRWTDAQNRDAGTIMSYAGYRLPYYSNPDLTADGATIGVPAGQPKAADNVRVLRENAADMAAYRTAPAPPTITEQPADAALTEGDTLSLSVTASGAGLSYQWYKGGAAIANATSSTYTKSAVKTTDAGDYTVVVTNSVDAVTSDTATVTVTAKTTTGGGSTTTTTGGGSTSGGGGGGGGAPSGWFVAALALAGALRVWATGRRRGRG